MRISTVVVSFAALVVLSACGEPLSERFATGARAYTEYYASCRGAKREGQSNWRQKQPNGGWPAPPHDDSGHTWHHSDQWLFHVIENGTAVMLKRPDYESDMPAFEGKRSDSEIRAVRAYIKSHWSEETLRKRDEMLSKRRAQSATPALFFLDPHS
ncbi:MAG: cytochrome c [Burkholderiales bacterium]